MRTKFPILLCAALLLSAPLVFAQTAPAPANPVGKFYVAEAEGLAQINTGTKIEDLAEKGVFNAEGAILETRPDSSRAIVLSNGIGLQLSPDTKLVVTRFQQESFTPDRADLESEPSVSQTRAELLRGTISVCTGRLIAGSTLVYTTPHIGLNVLGQSSRKFTLQVTETSTVITLFEGAITLRGDNLSSGQSLEPGSQAVIQTVALNTQPSVTIGPIPENQREALENLVNRACQARSQVYFDTAASTEASPGELQAIPVNPVNPGEVGPVISPARP